MALIPNLYDLMQMDFATMNQKIVTTLVICSTTFVSLSLPNSWQAWVSFHPYPHTRQSIYYLLLSSKPAIFNHCVMAHWCVMNDPPVCSGNLGQGGSLNKAIGECESPIDSTPCHLFQYTLLLRHEMEKVENHQYAEMMPNLCTRLIQGIKCESYEQVQAKQEYKFLHWKYRFATIFF